MAASDNGRKFSIIGWIAVIGILMGALGLLILAVGAANREKVKRYKCLNQLRQIGLGIKMYGVDSSDAYPEAGTNLVSPHFRLISREVGNTAQIFVCSEDPARKRPASDAASMTDANVSYCYVRGLSESTPIDHPLAFESYVGGTAGDGKPLSEFEGQPWTAGHRPFHETKMLGFTLAIRNIGTNMGGYVLYAGAHVRLETVFPTHPAASPWTNIVEVP